MENAGWDNTPITNNSAEWYDYPTGDEHTVVGTVKISDTIYGPMEGMRRRLLAYLPPSYHMNQEKRYPVLYMNDGQNLFDKATSFSGEWRVDETMEALSAEGIEAIIIGIENSGPGRAIDYSAHKNSRLGGGGADAYLDLISLNIKPLVDASFRTLPDPEHTGIMGSSMGGSLSFYAKLTRPDLFGFAGVMSPAFWWSEGTLFPFVKSLPFTGGRIYMDVGDSEIRQMKWRTGRYESDTIRMNELLRSKGYTPDNLYFTVEEGGKHNEETWARRLPTALRFLLGPITREA